jgi:hypothetical protein
VLGKVKVRLRPLISNTNLTTVIKSTIFPGDRAESLIIATQPGEIFYLRNGVVGTFLDISSNVIELGTTQRGYDERGLLGLAFHPGFFYNGLFYIHYTVAGSQGPGALSGSFEPNPCDPETLNLKWTNREQHFDHIDTIEEWILEPDSQPIKNRTLLNIRRPFLNHNGVNSLNFSPETGRLVLTTGDGGLGYDPFNLSQNDMEIAGKIIELDISMNTFVDNPPVVTRFDEIPEQVQAALTVIAKGVRNIPGISYQRINNHYIKYVGNVGQDLVESIYSFIKYVPIPVSRITQTSAMNMGLDYEGFVNFGWRGWEGIMPTSIISDCDDNRDLKMLSTAYYDDAVRTSVKRLMPLTCYYHIDSRSNKFGGTALTGVQAYMGNEIPELTRSVIFTDFVRDGEPYPTPARGVLAYTKLNPDCKISDYSIIETDYDFGAQSSFYTCLGSNQDQTRLFLGVYGSERVVDYNQGTIFEIIP